MYEFDKYVIIRIYLVKLDLSQQLYTINLV